MFRLRCWSLLACSMLWLTASLSATRGQAPPKAQKAEEKDWAVDRSLTVTPQPAPVPALKYRLFPLYSERKAGNAVPIYLRLIHEQTDQARKYWTETPQKWNDLPIDQVPLGEAKEFLTRMRPFYRQFDLGARRTTAEWNYTFDQGTVIDILLPDVAVIRNYVPMMVLRARVALAEGDFAAAAHALETGFAFSRHVADGPFMINQLAAIGCANPFADALLDFVERPNAPNLYWSLTALPRPLIGLQIGMDFEQRFLELQFPMLTDLDRPRSAEQWDALLKQIRTEMKQITDVPEGPRHPRPPAGTGPDDPAANSPDLPAARRYLTDRLGKPAAEVAALPPAQVLLLYLMEVARVYRDEQFQAAYLPYPQARPILAEAAKRLDAAPASEALWLTRMLMPAFGKVMAAQARLERRIAALRAIEALRLHAATHGGQLPERLDQVTAVPVPDDPGTGKPFEYRKEGATATLTSRVPDEPANSGLRYRITMRVK